MIDGGSYAPHAIAGPPGPATTPDGIAVGAIVAVVTAVFTAARSVAIMVTAIYAKRTLVAAKGDSRALDGLRCES